MALLRVPAWPHQCAASVKLPLAEELADFDFARSPINEGLVRKLAVGTLSHQRKSVLVGEVAMTNAECKLATEALQSICDLDLNELQAIKPPRRSGRD